MFDDMSLFNKEMDWILVSFTLPKKIYFKHMNTIKIISISSLNRANKLTHGSNKFYLLCNNQC